MLRLSHADKPRLRLMKLVAESLHMRVSIPYRHSVWTGLRFAAPKSSEQLCRIKLVEPQKRNFPFTAVIFITSAPAQPQTCQNIIPTRK